MLEKLRSGEPLTAKEKQIHDQGLVTVLRQIHDELDEAVLEAYGWGDLAGTALRSGPANESPLNRADAPEDKDSPILVPCTGPPGMQGERQRNSINREALSAWPEATRSLPGDALLTRLVALNHERAAEEKRGLIRWLRPDYQNPTKASDGHRPPLQATFAGTETSSPSPIPNFQSTILWPDRLPDQVAILRKLITGYDKSIVTPDAETLSNLFGRKNKKRTEQIEGILETLKGLGRL